MAGAMSIFVFERTCTLITPKSGVLQIRINCVDKMATKPKFLVLHPDPSNLNEVANKINLQNAKIGPFAAVILLGNIDNVSIETRLDVPTYYLEQSKTSNEEENDIHNLIGVCLPSLIKLKCGVTMAFVETQSQSCEGPQYSGKADLLFSFHWPLALAAAQQLTLVANRTLDPIVQSLQPRYHFAIGTDSGRYLESPPFAWNGERACRFISLGREKSGSKWFYAFGLGSEADDTSLCLANPFIAAANDTVTQARDHTESQAPPLKLERLRNRLPEQDDNAEALHEKKRVRVSPESCFFCLSNPKVETHMIVAIGKHSYLTIAKGPLTLPNKTLNISGHGLLIPIKHTATGNLPDETRKELNQFQETISLAFMKVNYSVVFFEISRPENVHFHIQMIPVPKKLLAEQFQRALEIKTEVNNEKFVKNHKLKFEKFLPNDVGGLTALMSLPYVRFSIYEGLEPTEYYVSSISENHTVDLQFPRRVLAFLLKLPKRQNWDRCRQTEAEEVAECKKFKSFYEKYDFTSSE